MTVSLSSREIEAVVVHHFVPRHHEVTHELLLRVLLCVNLGEGSPEQIARVTQAFLPMKKFDLAELQRAYAVAGASHRV